MVLNVLVVNPSVDRICVGVSLLGFCCFEDQGLGYKTYSSVQQ
jgi:hypothetical protein